jgi:hypothetical protein
MIIRLISTLAIAVLFLMATFLYMAGRQTAAGAGAELHAAEPSPVPAPAGG